VAKSAAAKEVPVQVGVHALHDGSAGQGCARVGQDLISCGRCSTSMHGITLVRHPCNNQHRSASRTLLVASVLYTGHCCGSQLSLPRSQNRCCYGTLCIQVVVVAPSQELAMQIVRVAQSMLPGPARTMVQQCIGGANPKYQLVGGCWGCTGACASYLLARRPQCWPEVYAPHGLKMRTFRLHSMQCTTQQTPAR
jgi:hypothetical protein